MTMAELKTEYKHVDFLFQGIDWESKSAIYICSSKSSGYDLGEIKWYAPWGQYCFYDTANGIYSKTCMRDIADFIEQLTNHIGRT